MSRRPEAATNKCNLVFVFMFSSQVAAKQDPRVVEKPVLASVVESTGHTLDHTKSAGWRAQA